MSEGTFPRTRSLSVAAIVGAALLPAGCLAPPVRAMDPGEDRTAHWREPERPRVSVDTTDPPRRGRVLTVAAGQDLQRVLDDARPGDEIVVEAGAAFTGPFRLPRKRGRDWIVVRSSALEDLPPPGRRVRSRHAAAMPWLHAARGTVVEAERGAHHFRLVGLRITPSPRRYLRHVVELGHGDERGVEDLPHHVVLDRCIVAGDPERGSRRGVVLNGWALAVVDSRVTDFKDPDAEAQAIAGWNGPGPFKVENNLLQGAGENVLFGGADPTLVGLVPSDIEVLRNHLSKPADWAPSARGAWVVKNLFELKNARRVIVEGNVLERNWVAAQNGFAVLFTPRNQEGTAPWSVVEDVTFENNVVRDAPGGVNILGRDERGSRPTRRVLIRNNLFQRIGGRLLQILDGTSHVAVVHNTAEHGGNAVTAGGQPHAGFVFRDNVVFFNDYGIVGDGRAPGVDSLQAYFPDSVVEGNVIVGGRPEVHPPLNFFPARGADVGFVAPGGEDYRLAPHSPYRGRATDGLDVGADFAALSGRGGRRGP